MEAEYSSEDPIEIVDEVRVPCLICGINIEINNIIKQEVPEFFDDNENAGNTEECELGVGDSIESRVFHRFLKWFGVDIVKNGRELHEERGWDGEGGDILRFCGNCKLELVGILELQKQLDELEERIKNGLGEVKGKMEISEEGFQSNHIYEMDQRYKLVRDQILKCGRENAEHQPQEDLGSSVEQPVGQNSCRKSPRKKVKTNTTVSDDADGLIIKRPSNMTSSLDKGSADRQLTSNLPNKSSDRLCNISDNGKRSSLARAAKKIAQKKVSEQNSAKLVNKLTQKKEIRRQSSRIKEKIVPEKVSSQNTSQVTEKTVQKKVSIPMPSKTDKPDDKQDRNSSLSLGKNNDQDSNSKTTEKKLLRFKLDPLTKTITYGAFKFSICKDIQDNVSCTLCNATVKNRKKSMRRHVVMEHKKLYACPKCPFTGEWQKRLDAHIKTVHEGILEKCLICGKSYMKLDFHMKYKHGDMATFKCPEKGCWKSFKLKSCLVVHKNAVHKKLKPWKCTVCSMAFARKGSLKCHMDLHKGIRPWKCQVNGCGAAFVKKWCLQNHHRNFHEEGSRPRRHSYQRGPTILITKE